MEGGAVGHTFERDLPRDHPCQVRFNLVQRFQRRRFKCESLRRTTDGRTDGRRTPSDGKSSPGLWPGELKRQKSIPPTPSQESERSCICVKRCIPIKTVSTLRISVWCTWHYFFSVLLLTFDTFYTLVMC